MKRTSWHPVIICTLLFIAATPSPSYSAHPKQQAPASAEASDSNPLITEMRTLNIAYRDIVSAVALGDNAGVLKATETLHGVMEKTHQGMHAGTVMLPKNPGRVKEFEERDLKFHARLEALDRAARHNNQREMLRTTKQLLDGCVQCHQLFRK